MDVKLSRYLLCLVACSAVAQTLPDGPGKETFQMVCSMCHSPTAVIGQQGTKQWWQSKVTEMLQEVTDVPAADVDAIVSYLAKNFPIVKINVNKAPAKDLETGLGLTAKESEAIVSYREAQGQFQNARGFEKGAGRGRGEDRIEKGASGILMGSERFKVPSHDGVEISVQKAGSGPALLLIHGALLNGSLSWGAVMPKLAEHFTVYAMDRRGRAPVGRCEGIFDCKRGG